MKIAIVEDAGCLEPHHYWSGVWERLSIEHKVPYKTFNSEQSGFVTELSGYHPDTTLWRSSHRQFTKRKDQFQRYTLEKVSGLKILPDWDMRYLYDSKVQQTYLFQLKNYPHPETITFYDKQEAKEWLQTAKYPFVVKGDAGAGSCSMRLIDTPDNALIQLNENFSTGLVVCRPPFELREQNLFYAQEYIKADGIYRIVMVGDDVGYSFYQSNRPGTVIASSQGFDSYPETPVELLNLSSRINKEMGWLWMMYDYIWDVKSNRWLILELTDTCAFGHSSKRQFTHYKKNGNWEAKPENSTPAELVFKKYALQNGDN